ncbi:hypothetical protein CBR_g45893 [Chara braunii]|uniref:Uncharacterized protein n=1 Tax=Chara braunii TaxID=69332 RepID=A0A388LZU7_CHABU|nr:hypothetical protein CBR_g45893 [Chara braunii]|eukprot:GBG87739.1 hypothetical protein CBR_g45893 [Chara braunii]
MNGSRHRNKQSQPRHPPDEVARRPRVGSSHRKECAGPSQPSGRQHEGTPVITYERKAVRICGTLTCQKDDGGASRRVTPWEISEGSNEETEDDPWICVGRHPQGNHAVGDEECGVDEDNVEEEKCEDGYEGEDREESMHDCEGGESRQYYEEDDGGDGENDDAYPVVDEDERHVHNRGVLQEGSAGVEVDEATGERSEGNVVYKWDDVEVLTRSWYKHYTPSTTLNKYDNIAVRYTDMMAIVLHAENDNLDNITVAPKLRAKLTNLNVEEGEFVRCSRECIGVSGNIDPVYSWMERESARLRKLCSSFIREDDGVMMLGRAHAGLIWELARAGHLVFACDDATKELTYLSKFLEFYVKDPRNKCRFEKPQVEHRKDRDIYYKLERKREKVWAYLFSDAPQSAVDNEYFIKKIELEIAMNEYYGSHMGAFHMFVACCEHLFFNMKKKALSSRDYADLARKAGNFNNTDCDEDTSDSDLDVPSRTARGVAEGAHTEEPQGSTNEAAEKENSSLGATLPYLLQDKFKESSEEDWCHHILWHGGVFKPCVFAGKWHMAVKTRDRGWVAKEKKDIAIWHSVTETQLFRRVEKENVDAGEVAIAAKAKTLFEHLRANKQLEFNTKFYDLASSVSYGSIDWKIKQPSAVQGIESTNSLKTQDVIASNTIVVIARGDEACQTDTRANAGDVRNEQHVSGYIDVLSQIMMRYTPGPHMGYLHVSGYIDVLLNLPLLTILENYVRQECCLRVLGYIVVLLQVLM